MAGCGFSARAARLPHYPMTRLTFSKVVGRAAGRVRGLIEVSRGGGDTIRLMVPVLSRIDEDSGHAESWWEGDGFRVHLWRTTAGVFEQGGPGKWVVWARDDNAAERARSFVRR